jgi:aminoglycoside phosphotransferase (APT) family kinase protein
LREGHVAPVAELLDEGADVRIVPPRTWPQFLGDHVAYRHAALAAYVSAEDRRLVEQLARANRRAEAAALCLLHGDCGAHNFLFERRRAHLGRLRAVIDPAPLVGHPIFDLAFAFVSWPHGLEPEAILPAAEALRDAGRWRPNGELRRVLWEEVLIALYMRMATSLVHHLRDLPAYLEAWPRWRALVS